MNSKFNIAPLGASLFLIMAIFVGCSKGEIRPSGSPSDGLDPSSGDPISFYSENETTKANEIQSDPAGFRVWSWFTSTAHPDGIDMFLAEGTQVKHDGTSWTYKPTRYWLRGNYDFAAVHPYSVTGTYATDENSTEPVLKISNYDVTNQDSLRVAFTSGVDGSLGTANNPVELNFKHALSNIRLQLKLDEDSFFVQDTDENGEPVVDNEGNPVKTQIGQAVVSTVELKNISMVGTFSSNSSDFTQQPWTASTTKTTKTFTPTDQTASTLEKTNKDFMGENGFLVIPQSTSGIVLYLEINITHISGTTTTKEYNIQLGSFNVKDWMPNSKYLYHGEITQELVITFSVTRVNDWEEENLGDFIVGKEEEEQ